jgi:hypothetical protein
LLLPLLSLPSLPLPPLPPSPCSPSAPPVQTPVREAPPPSTSLHGVTPP